MKKIFISALATITLLVGCAKENAPVLEKHDIKVNFTVTEKAGFEANTKAVKAGWSIGDEILIIFKGNSGWIPPFSNNNTVKLIKTSEGWNADTSKLPTELTGLVDGGSFAAWHYPGTISIGAENYHIFKFPLFDSYKGGEYMECIGTYTISGTELNLGTISLARPSDGFQISVKNMTTNGKEWYIDIYSEFTDGTLKHTGLSQGGSSLISCRIDMTYANIGTFGEWKSKGIQNGEDVSFFFRSISDEYEGTTLYFHLYSNAADNYWYKTTSKTPSELEGKAWSLPTLSEWETDINDL